jgi:beta-glucosidase
VKVTNKGKVTGEEVVQLYITDEKASTPRPVRSLEGFDRVSLQPGQSKNVKFVITPRQLSLINDKDQRVIEPGYFSISMGGKQPGFSGRTDAATTGVVTGRFKITGKVVKLEN